MAENLYLEGKMEEAKIVLEDILHEAGPDEERPYLVYAAILKGYLDNKDKATFSQIKVPPLLGQIKLDNYHTDLLRTFFDGIGKPSQEWESPEYYWAKGLRAKLKDETQQAAILLRKASQKGTPEDFGYFLAKKELGEITTSTAKMEGQTINYSLQSSSTLYSSKMAYGVSHLLDGRDDTAWVEGVSGDGIGSWLELSFPFNCSVKRLVITNGYTKNQQVYMANNRVKKLRVLLEDGKEIVVEFKDEYKTKTAIELGAAKGKIKLEILEVYPGTKYQDTAISEIGLEMEEANS